jgi:hypothetical protein
MLRAVLWLNTSNLGRCRRAIPRVLGPTRLWPTTAVPFAGVWIINRAPVAEGEPAKRTSRWDRS